MIIKWIILAILAWYVFKTAGNLLRAVQGGREIGSAPRSDPSRPASTKKPSESAQDVEDARFVDLP